MKLDQISRAAFQDAVRIYLEEAYGQEAVPAEVRKRLDWPAGESLERLASGEAFERVPAGAPPQACEHLRLRLGNRQYPHMKLSADRVPGSDEWVLTVDCHDRHIAGAVTEDQRAALEALFRANAEVKGRIERRWAEAGLPTFANYVHRRLGQCGRQGRRG